MVTNYSQVEAYLAQIPMFSNRGLSAMKDYNLSTIRAFLAEIGDPQHQFFSVHIAGTNGKGSCVKMLETIFTRAGYKTAAYISPHLIQYRERFQINGIQVDEQVLVDFFNKYIQAIEQHALSYFEIATAFAFWWFAQEKVDIALIECGLGGRLDATNVLEDKLSVLTSVSLDHTEILGNTYRKIALEKVAISRSGKQLIHGQLNDEALAAVTEYALEHAVNLLEASKLIQVKAEKKLGKYKIKGWSDEVITVQTSLLNPIQAKNIEVILSVCKSLSDQYPIKQAHVVKGLKEVKLLARFEQLLPDERWFFDGFHNEESFDLILDIVSKEQFKPFFILAFMRDKWTKSLAEKIKKLDVIMISLDNDRALTQKDAPEFNWGSFSSLDEIFNNFNKSLVIVGGSFYFYRSIKEWLSLYRTKIG